jgi:hypothetical protein
LFPTPKRLQFLLSFLELKCSGRYVEDVVAGAIKKFTFKQPCLSFVLDPANPVWKKHLTPVGMKEVKEYNRPKMPTIDQNVQSYIDSFGQDFFCKYK